MGLSKEQNLAPALYHLQKAGYLDLIEASLREYWVTCMDHGLTKSADDIKVVLNKIAERKDWIG